MPAELSVSLLITPDQRRRLQQRYEEAQRLAIQPRPDYQRVHELLAGCVVADPGNILYLDALLANLRRRDSASGQSWWRTIGRKFSSRLFRSRSPATRRLAVAATAADFADSQAS